MGPIGGPYGLPTSFMLSTPGLEPSPISLLETNEKSPSVNIDQCRSMLTNIEQYLLICVNIIRFFLGEGGMDQI